jgi:prepilin-type N-terminal cleavage/methylation domain-containing protein
MVNIKHKNSRGFSLLELLIAMTLVCILLAIVSTVLGKCLGIRSRESRKTDALTSAQAALNIMSREISNSGFGIYDGPITRTANNGLILGDCNTQRIHLRTNINNYGPRATPTGTPSTVINTMDPGEDITYFFDSATNSIVRYDPHATPQTSVVVNKISNVTFQYIDYVTGTSTAQPPANAPTSYTGRITITVTVDLDPVQGQPSNQSITFTSDVTLRNSNYMLNQY